MFKSLDIGLRTEGPIKTVIVVPVIPRILKTETYHVILQAHICFPAARTPVHFYGTYITPVLWFTKAVVQVYLVCT